MDRTFSVEFALSSIAIVNKAKTASLCKRVCVLIELDLSKVLEKLNNKQTFVLNVIASWCPDCTERQAPNLENFSQSFDDVNLEVVNLLVQEEKRVYLTQEHQEFVNGLGGHGFPRTVLFVNGNNVDSDNVEIITEPQLEDLSQKFRSLL